MAENLFKRYLWTLNTIRSFGPITFEDINKLWKRSSLNPSGEMLPKKTFRNHINAIVDTFDIEILCERKGGYRYYIGDNLLSDKWTQDYLNSLLFQFSLLDDDNVRDTVCDIDNEHDIDNRIYFLLGCIKHHLVISFTYYKSYADLREQNPTLKAEDINRKHTNFAPIGLVHADREWYVIGKALDSNLVVPIKVSPMKDLSALDGISYHHPLRFSIKDYVNSFTFSYDAESICAHANDDSSSFQNAIQFSPMVIR